MIGGTDNDDAAAKLYWRQPGFGTSVTSSGAGILERFACLRDEFPLIASGRKRYLQHAERIQIAHFAIGTNHSKRTKILAAGAHHEFADAAAGIGDAVGILWRESFVIVVMAVDDHVRVGCVKGVHRDFMTRSLPCAPPELKSGL